MGLSWQQSPLPPGVIGRSLVRALRIIIRRTFLSLAITITVILMPQLLSAASVYDYDLTTIDYERIHLRDFKGKVLMIVNVASRCGYTPQYCPSPIIDLDKKLLCRDAFISVMEAAELWNGDNLSHHLCLSRKRTLLAQAQVRSRFMVVAEIGRQRSLEMGSV